jgi:nucleoside-diphosphate-sugar epimerase
VTLRVAVTGSNGFIGRNLTAALAARGVEVMTIARPFEAGALAGRLRSADVVVHLAGVVAAVRDREFFVANVEGTRTVAAAARAAGTRLIHISSLAAAGPAPASRPRAEVDPSAPVTPYGRSKLEAEHVVAAMSELRWTILRLAAVYGPHDRAMLPLFRFAWRGVLPLAGNPTAAYTFVHVRDVVRAIEAAIASDAAGATLFVGHPRPVTAREIVAGVCSAVGRSAAIVRVPALLLRGGATLGDLVGVLRRRPALLNRWRYAELSAEGFVCRVDRLRDELGVVAQTDLDAGLAETAEWYRKEGWL